MKIIFIWTLFLLCYNSQLYGQSIIRSNVGAAGSSQIVDYNNKTYYISQSIGQASIIGTSANGNHIIRQGFQQPLSNYIIGTPSASTNLDARIYPNPFTHAVKVSFNEEINQDVSVFLLDVSGKTILDKKFTASQSVIIPLENISSGSYIINVQTGQRRLTTTLIKQ